ncbi:MULTISPECIES: pilus assembly protein [Burkholderia]|uniref:Flp family type IVb pilin n=1 Tax=Burkholderia TaxID=32008 RepID=UPI000AC26C7F|nr:MULTISPECIES: pilus assembly protein [Burkholderia]
MPLMKQFNAENRRRIRKQLGQGMTEYIIIVALIAVSAIAVYAFFGKTVRDQTAGLATELSGKSGQSNISSAQADAGTATTEAGKTKGLGSYTNDSINSSGGK